MKKGQKKRKKERCRSVKLFNDSNDIMTNFTLFKMKSCLFRRCLEVFFLVVLKKNCIMYVHTD